MNLRIENLAMLFGLVALAVPILLHLLQRRRYDTLDWGAMQFLPDSSASQRKRWLDEILLMLLRMAMIALIVLALATPISTSPWLAALGDRSSRATVIVLDGSFSMDVRVPDQPTPWSDALRLVRQRLDRTSSGESIALIIARDPPELKHPFDDIATIEPAGNPAMTRALSDAWQHLQHSRAARKEIIVLTDGQHYGWVDAATLAALDNLGNQWRGDNHAAKETGVAIPTLRVIAVGAPLPKSLPNYRLTPLTTPRGVVKVGQKFSVRSALHLDGFIKPTPPRGVYLEVDGKKFHDFDVQLATPDAPTPLQFPLTFAEPGRHVVSLKLDLGPTPDALPADNQQALPIVVKDWPVLILDGDDKLSEESSSLFLDRALQAEKTIPYQAFDAATLEAVKPSVIVLADVPRLEPAQIEWIEKFLSQGGGLFIFAGERVEKESYNGQLYRGGKGWLPVRLGEAMKKGDNRPNPRTFQHPALAALRSWPEPSLRDVTIKKWWTTVLAADDRVSVLARLNNGDPFLLEKAHARGRVILCTVPPDRRWESTLPKVGEFLILAYELCYYLAGNREAAAASPLDAGESDLTRCTEDDWRKVRDRLPVDWQTGDAEDSSGSSAESRREELWWLLLLGVVGLLCSELWMTRRLALARGRS